MVARVEVLDQHERRSSIRQQRKREFLIRFEAAGRGSNGQYGEKILSHSGIFLLGRFLGEDAGSDGPGFIFALRLLLSLHLAVCEVLGRGM